MGDKDALFKVTALEVALPDMAAKTAFGRAPLIPILKGIDLTIERGKVLGIVGGSGSGKSTLGRALLRLIEPTAGTIEFGGRDITHLKEEALRPIRRRMQMIFQDPMSSLNPRRRIGAIIADPMLMHGFDRVSARVDDALDHVGLPRGFRSRYPHELSGGSASALALPGRSRSSRSSFSQTRSSPASTCRLRPRCSMCWATWSRNSV